MTESHDVPNGYLLVRVSLHFYCETCGCYLSGEVEYLRHAAEADSHHIRPFEADSEVTPPEVLVTLDRE